MKVLPLVLATGLLTGCSRSPSKDGLITSFGEYPAPDKRHILKVERRQNSLVVGSLISSNSTVLFSEEIGSDVMRWCFFWGTNGSFWAYSSDTGYFKRIMPGP